MSLISSETLQSLQDKILIACEVCPHYLKNSLFFSVPFKVSELKERVRKINLHQHLPIVLYDKGSMYSASRVYVFLNAVGFKNLQVLYGGLLSVSSDPSQLTPDRPDLVPLTERMLLSYKNNYLITKEEYIQMNTPSANTLYSDFLNKHIYDFYTTLNKDNIKSFILSCRIKLETLKDIVIYGDISCLLAVFLHYLDFDGFYVLVDNFDTSVLELKENKTETETVYVSLGDASDKSFTSVELEHYAGGKKGEKAGNEASNSTCGKCCVII